MEYNQSLFFLHLLQFPRRYSAQIMHRLEQRGHHELRLSFEPIIIAVSAGPLRVTDLARLTGMHKQNCTQLVKRIESAGYLQRVDDPQDGRSRLLGLSPAGEQLLHDALAVVGDINVMLASVVGTTTFNQLRQTIHDLCAALPVAEPPVTGVSRAQGSAAELFSEISRLAQYTGMELNLALHALGYTEIRPVHEQVLLHLGEGRVRIQEIARANDVSRQAISAIVNELQQLRYIRLEVDPVDARGRIIALTSEGNTLVERAAQAADALMRQYQSLVGKQRLQLTRQTMATAYRTLAEAERTTPGPSLEVVQYLLLRLKGAVGVDGKLQADLLQGLATVPLDAQVASSTVDALLGSQERAVLDAMLERLSVSP